MNTVILIVVLNLGAYSRTDNSSVNFQEFNSMTQCQYAAKIIQESANKVRFAHCINK